MNNYPGVAVAVIIAPRVVPDLVVNSALLGCAAATSTIREAISHALQELNLPNVSLYLDIGHGGSLHCVANFRSYLKARSKDLTDNKQHQRHS